MVIVEDFEKVVKWHWKDISEDILYLWGNDEVDNDQLLEIVKSGNWTKLQDVDGFFAGVYETSSRIYLFCDRLGIWPLFYFADGTSVYCSPRLGKILNAIQSDLAPCKDGIVSLLLFGHHLSGETVFGGVRRCNGGETIVIDSNGEIEERIVWKKKHIYQDKSSMAPKELAELFVERVNNILPKNGDVILPVSGGFDSRCVLGAVLECIESERICIATFGGEDTIDFQISQLIANKIGAKNQAFPISGDYYNSDDLRRKALDSGYTYSAFTGPPLQMYSYLSQEASKGILTIYGAGGDAITGSHLHSSDNTPKRCDSFEDIISLLIEKRCYVSLDEVSKLLNLEPKEAVQIVARLLEESMVEKYDKPWQFLDAWDIFVRGRMELINLLPFNDANWRCPHLNRAYFNMMSTQCFEEKLHQNMYRRMISSRFKFLFSLPTKRLGGGALLGSPLQNIGASIRWQAARLNRFLRNQLGFRTDSAGRNFGKDQEFFGSSEGRKELQHALDILKQPEVFRCDLDNIFEMVLGNTLLASTLITLGYAFDK
ncbi:MAG: asparagine synthetase B family protein [Planctomycetota bacterium]|jgi:asparagine synthetase B (glutamine-hydrolysing)